MSAAVIYIVLALAALIVLISFFRSGHFLRSLLASVLQGAVSLFAVNALGTLTGVTLAVNPATLGAVGLFGIPGTISMVLLDTIFYLR